MKTVRILSLSVGCFLAAGSALAVAPGDLQQRLADGEKLTLIDVRATAFFQRGHIPGSINVPAEIIADKQLPRIGKVVVYDGGLGETNAVGALLALQGKAGITAELLDGGMAAWLTAKGETTAEPGLARGDLPQISYDRLKSLAANKDTVIVDLRSSPSRTKSTTGQTSQTDLVTEFPGAHVTKSPFSVGPQKTAIGRAGAAPLLVLIDSGDGSAQATGRLLKANGNHRFVILAGGEEMLARKGKSGLQRSGTVLIMNGKSGVLTETNR